MGSKWRRVVLASAVLPGALAGVAVVAPGLAAATVTSHYPLVRHQPELGFFVASERPLAVLALGKKLGVGQTAPGSSLARAHDRSPGPRKSMISLSDQLRQA